MLQTRQQQLRDKKTKYWQPHLEQWQKSELSATEYCQQHNINVHQFKYWQYQLLPKVKKISATPIVPSIAFTEINSSSINKQSEPYEGLEILLISGHRIRIPNNFNEKAMKQLLQLLGAM